MLCGDHSLCSYHEGELAASRLRCRSWLCDECLSLRLSELRRLAASGQPCTLITLTVRPGSQPSPHLAAQALVKAWRLIRQRAAREGLASKIEYLAVFEATRRGWPHLHILARSPYLPQRWLSARMKEYADSPIVDIRRVYNRRHASRYIAKYVSKGPGKFEGTKRYFRSQGYALEEQNPQPVADANRVAWHSWDNLETIRRCLVRFGWTIETDDPDRIVAYATDEARWMSAKPPPDEEEERWQSPAYPL